MHAAILRRYGRVVDPWGLTPYQWMASLDAVTELLENESIPSD